MAEPALPQFIIVGAMKAGSTSLRFHLNNHPQLHLAAKELNFFNNQANFVKGLGWYQQQIKANAKASASVYGEKSPAYSQEDFVAERIAQTLPEVKIVWVLRNPIDRAYSNYLHEYKLGWENLSFKKALQKEEQRSKKDIRYGYTQHSDYTKQLQHYYEFIPKAKHFVLFFEELIKPYGPNHKLNELFAFLGVQPDGFQYQSEQRNPTILPRYKNLLYYSRKLGLNRSWKLKKLVENFAYRNVKPGYPALDPVLRKELQTYFEPKNKALAALLDRQIPVWE